MFEIQLSIKRLDKKKNKKQNDNELEPQDIKTIFYRKFSARTQEKAKKITLPKKLLL